MLAEPWRACFQALMKKDDPGAANNRRVSIIVQYNKPKPKPEEKGDPAGKDAHGKSAKGKDEHGKKENETPPPDAHAGVKKEAPAKPEAKTKPEPAVKNEPAPKASAADPASDKPKKKRRKKKADEAH